MIKTMKFNKNEVNPFLHHSEIFLSEKETKNINFLKLLSIGKFGKVIIYF